MKIERPRVTRAFGQYVNRFDLSDVKVKLKYEHTFRVAQKTDRIAKSIWVSKSDRDLAWFLGILHGIGRFEQLRQYSTFLDKKV